MSIQIRNNLQQNYSDVYTTEAIGTLNALADFNSPIKRLMSLRLQRRKDRWEKKLPIGFPDINSLIPGTSIKVSDAREGKFDGARIPKDLERQWIQGTGPAAKPNAPLESSIRNVSYALLSGADGWMFD